MTTFCPDCQRPVFDDLIHECRHLQHPDPVEHSLLRENLRLTAMNRYLTAELVKALAERRPASQARGWQP